MLLWSNGGRWWKLDRKIVVTLRTVLFLNARLITTIKRDYSTVKVVYKKEI